MKATQLLKRFVFGPDGIHSSGKYPSVNEVLTKLIGGKALQRIQLATPDRRQLLEEVAKFKKLSQDELIKQIADALNLPVFFRPKPTDVDLLPPGVMLPDLRRAGVLPITAQGSVTGIVCVDPASLNLMPHLYTGSNLYLSSWQSVLSALDASEALFREKRAQHAAAKRRSDESLFAKVLGRIAEQARNEGAEQIYLLSDFENLTYSFKNQSAQDFQGNIDAKISLDLAQYLEDLIAGGRHSIVAEGAKGAALRIQLSCEHGRIILGLPASKSIEPETDFLPGNESAKVVQFPRLVRKVENAQNYLFLSEEKAKVILVDDNPTFAGVLQKYLKKQGLSVEICPSVEAALFLLKAGEGQLPDLIISDIHMPGVNGLEFIRQLKSESLWKQIPVIALTSDESSETELSLLDVGADAFVSKTKDPRILCVHAKRLLDLRPAA